MSADSLLEYGNLLRSLGEEAKDACAVTVGFSGAGGGYMPMMAPPALLLHCPASLLLHDVIWVSDHVFDLDSDDPLESVPYRVLDRLNKEGLVRYVPCSGQPAAEPLRAELERQAADLVSGLVDEEEAPQVDRQEVQRALLERRAPEALVETGEWNEFLNLFRQTYDTLYLQGLGQVLGCAYSVEIDDSGIHVAQHRSLGPNWGPTLAARLRIPICRGSILLDDEGEPADILPEAALIQQRVLRGKITVQDPDGTKRPYRAPNMDCSDKAIDRLLAFRERTEFAELQKIVRDWHTVVNWAASDDSILDRAIELLEAKIDGLLPSLGPALFEFGEPAFMFALMLTSEVQDGMAQTILGNALPQRPTHHIAQFGPVSSLAGYSVRRHQPQQAKER